MTTMTGFRHSLTDIVPEWLSNRPGLRVGFSLLYAIASTLDTFSEIALQAGYAAWPGKGDSSALPFIGQSRGIGRGESESDASYESRLIGWLDTWTNAGSDETLARQIQAYLGNTPMVRIINRAGFVVTLGSDGSVSHASTAWNWDSVSNPERAGWWSDLWIIIYPSAYASAPTIGSRAALAHDGLTTFGQVVTQQSVDAILALVHQWKGAHTWVLAIVWSYDATLFNPAAPVAGDPDGTWGNWGTYDATGRVVPARNGSCRFWIPPGGA